MNKETFDQLIKHERGTILYDTKINPDIRFLVMRGNLALCAYIGVNEEHPFAIKNYDYEEIDIECHFGLTFGGRTGDQYRPEGYLWYGWDYAHYGDACFYDPLIAIEKYGGLRWTVPDVVADSQKVIEDFVKLIKEYEK